MMELLWRVGQVITYRNMCASLMGALPIPQALDLATFRIRIAPDKGMGAAIVLGSGSKSAVSWQRY
jgi:hypothetical protein